MTCPFILLPFCRKNMTFAIHMCIKGENFLRDANCISVVSEGNSGSSSSQKTTTRCNVSILRKCNFDAAAASVTAFCSSKHCKIAFFIQYYTINYDFEAATATTTRLFRLHFQCILKTTRRKTVRKIGRKQTKNSKTLRYVAFLASR